MKSLIILSLALAFAFITVGNGLAAEKKLKPQTKCPVMGFEINKEVYVDGLKINKEVFIDHEGKRVYFCCPDCIEKFKAAPARYLKKMEKEGITLAKTPNPQTHCPVMGGVIHKKVFTDHKGRRIYFCCPKCFDTFQKDPEGHIKKMEDQGITFEKTPKT